MCNSLRNIWTKLNRTKDAIGIQSPRNGWEGGTKRHTTSTRPFIIHSTHPLRYVLVYNITYLIILDILYSNEIIFEFVNN